MHQNKLSSIFNIGNLDFLQKKFLKTSTTDPDPVQLLVDEHDLLRDDHRLLWHPGRHPGLVPTRMEVRQGTLLRHWLCPHDNR